MDGLDREVASTLPFGSSFITVTLSLERSGPEHVTSPVVKTEHYVNLVVNCDDITFVVQEQLASRRTRTVSKL